MSEVVTGDAVVLDVQIAQLPVRAVSAVIDLTVIFTGYMLGLMLWAASLSQFDEALTIAFLIIFTVLAIVGYPVAIETATRGRSVGKLVMGLRVVSDDGGPERGAVWILFLHADGTVRTQQKISSLQGGFTGDLDDADLFGWSVEGLGDLDGDGTRDLAVGAWLDDDAGPELDMGAVWILFLNPDGTVRDHQKISPTAGGFNGVLDFGDRFGTSLAFLGDLDGDGSGDLAVGSLYDDDGGLNAGSMWILFLHPDGTVKHEQKISNLEGGFGGILADQCRFGYSAEPLGDLDLDGLPDLAVGAILDPDGGLDRGAVWLLRLLPDGTVKRESKISSTQGGFTGPLDDHDSVKTCLGLILCFLPTSAITASTFR